MSELSQHLSNLLFELEFNRGCYLSGEALANAAGVSRNAIWKSISRLRKSGFEIDAINNRGYMLSPGFERLTREGIKAAILRNGQDHAVRDWSIEVFESLPSTNLYVKENVRRDLQNRVVIAKEQTGGIGRYGRSFFSPKDSGIYMSIKLNDPKSFEKREFLTVIAGLSVCDAICKYSNRDPKIKWVNDILIDEKKVCGILTQSWLDLESRAVDYFVVGIGINVFRPKGGFPQEISSSAGYVFDEKSNVLNKLIAQILIRLDYYLQEVDTDCIAKMYREQSMLIGRTVEVLKMQGHYPANVLDIDAECRLVVQREDGEIETLHSGEISIKLS